MTSGLNTYNQRTESESYSLSFHEETFCPFLEQVDNISDLSNLRLVSREFNRLAGNISLWIKFPKIKALIPNQCPPYVNKELKEFFVNQSFTHISSVFQYNMKLQEENRRINQACMDHNEFDSDFNAPASNNKFRLFNAEGKLLVPKFGVR